jgi:hypothetical protein
MAYTDRELGPVLKLPSGLIVKAADGKSAGNLVTKKKLGAKLGLFVTQTGLTKLYVATTPTAPRLCLANRSSSRIALTCARDRKHSSPPRSPLPTAVPAPPGRHEL